MLRSIFAVLLALSVFPSISAAQTIDVYILAGQSNMDGRGQVNDLSAAQLASLENDTMISFLNPGSERERAMPTSNPNDLDAGTNGFTALVPGGFSVDGTSARVLTPSFGPELSFGASIAEATGSNNQIALIKVSRGGTNLRNDWRADTTVDDGPDEPIGFLYRALLEEVTTRLADLEADGFTPIVRGFVWHQGESDSNQVSGYADRFVAFVEGVRAEFGDDIPFVLGELSRTRLASPPFNDNLPTVVASAPGLSFVSSEGLTTPADDTTHFDADGQIELGQRYAAAFPAVESDPGENDPGENDPGENDPGENEPPLPDSPVVFDFRTNGGDGGAFGADPAGTDFDPSEAGDTVTVGGLTATIVDVTSLEYDLSGPLPLATGRILSSAAGDGVETNVSGQDALGINNPSIGNTDFDLIGDGNDSADFNPGETVTFTFDHAVQFTEIELESVLPDDSFDVLVDGVPVLETTGDDALLDLGGLAGLTIAAGSEITFAVDGVLETATGGPATSLRIETFTVDVVEEAPVLKGDVNQDGAVNFADIAPFIAALQSGVFQAEADVDCSTVVNFLDIPPFIAALQQN